MSSRLDQLYQDTILDHNKSPRHFMRLENPTQSIHGKNPLCGDDYWVDISIEKNVITQIAFQGTGCAISKASGSLMALSLIGKTVDEALGVKTSFLKLITEETETSETQTQLGRLKVFEGVKKFPARVKCAALVWRALEAALESNVSEITTEKD